MSIFNKLKRKKVDEKDSGVKPDDSGLVKKDKSQVQNKQTDQKVDKNKSSETVTQKNKKTTAKKSDKKDYPFSHKIFIKPIITEKASFLGSYNQYVFEVSKNANKIEIKKAFQSIYGVEPVNVRVVNLSGKKVSYGRRRGRTKNWRKAIITLKVGDKIEIYEGV